MKKPTAPKHLSAVQKRLWNRILDEFVISDGAALRLLQSGLEALDRAEKCRVEIERDGQVIRDRFSQPKPHPLIAAERDARAAWVQCMKVLRLTEAEPPETKPKGKWSY